MCWEKTIPAAQTLDFQSPDLATEIARLPCVTAVYLLTTGHGSPYIGWTTHLRKRLARLLVRRTAPSNLLSNLQSSLTAVEYWPVGSKLETSLLLYKLARKHDPDHYQKRLKLRPPWFVTLRTADPFPRLAVQNRVPKRQALAYGPFRNRESAERFEQAALGLFQIRRCTETLAPDIDHPGCIYGEMNLCMRPCQLVVSGQEYATEVSRVQDFLDSNGCHQIALLSSARERASEQTDFEQAARLHKQIEAVKSAIALRDDVINEINHLHGVALTPAVGERRLALWPLWAGSWQAPVLLDFSMREAHSRPLDQQLRERLSARFAAPVANGDRIDEIALLSRWYYSTWRDGHWFPFRNPAELNYRKLVREISNLLRRDVEPSTTSA